MVIQTGTRLSRVQQHMRESRADLLVVGPSGNLRYLLGYQPVATERLMVLLIAPDDALAILPDFDAAEFAATTGFTDLVPWTDRDGARQAVRSAFARLSLPNQPSVLIDDELTFRAVNHLRDYLGTQPPGLASEILAEMRLIKTDDEVERIARAGEFVSLALDAALAAAQPGMTELDLQRVIEASLGEHGAEGEQYILVQAGSHSVSPHHVAGTTELRSGKNVLIDIAARFDGYYADITGQVFLGDPSDEYARAYDIVYAAQDAAVQRARAGATVYDVDAAASEVILASDFGPWNGPTTGHGLGVDVHEPPRLVSTNDTELRPGTVITIEPGVYIPDRFGIRIEDTVLVTDGAPRRLTRGSRPLSVKS